MQNSLIFFFDICHGRNEIENFPKNIFNLDEEKIEIVVDTSYTFL